MRQLSQKYISKIFRVSKNLRNTQSWNYEQHYVTVQRTKNMSALCLFYVRGHTKNIHTICGRNLCSFFFRFFFVFFSCTSAFQTICYGLLMTIKYSYKSAEEQFFSVGCCFAISFFFFSCVCVCVFFPFREIHVFFFAFTCNNTATCFVYVVVRLFLTVGLCLVLVLRARTRFTLNEIRNDLQRRFDRDDRANVACAIPRFASSATKSFGASALVLDCCRCPSLWRVRWCRTRLRRSRPSVRCSNPAHAPYTNVITHFSFFLRNTCLC